MRICINALLIEPGITGGGETFLVNLTERLSKLDRLNNYLILVTEENRFLFESLGANITCCTIIKSSRRKALRLLFENLLLPFHLLYHKVDLYYSPFGSLPLALFCKSAVTIQNLIYFDFRSNVPHRGKSVKSRLLINLQALYYKLITPITLRRADMIWAVSQTTAAVLKSRCGVDPQKIKVIYEGVDRERFGRSQQLVKQNKPFDFPYIVTVASLYPNKNIDKIISAFELVVREGFEHRLVVIGPDWYGYKSVLQTEVSRCGLDDRVIFTGRIDHDKLPPYLWGADLFVLVSKVESFGLPVLEAMAAGVPVIVSNQSSLPEIAGDAALVTSPEKRSLLARQIREVLADKSVSSRLVERGKSRARQFDWNETAVRAIDLFNNAG